MLAVLLTVKLLLVCLLAKPATGDSKIDCHPLSGATKESCNALGCIWEPKEQPTPPAPGEVREPWCYYPSEYEGYHVVQNEPNFYKLKRVRPSGIPDDIPAVMFNISLIKVQGVVVARFQVFDMAKKRFEPELPELHYEPWVITDENGAEDLSLRFSSVDGIFSVVRQATGAIIWATDLTKLIFADKFIQLNAQSGSRYFYGLGEHYDTFLKESNTYRTYSFYHTDQVPQPNGRSYSSFPFYVNLDSENQAAHGVYVRSSNAMDVVIQSDGSVTYRATGGNLDLFLIPGVTPMKVISQFQGLVGLPALPARWALGFHLCRYNYNSLEKTRLVWSRTRATKIPFDVQWNDIDYMDKYNDFTVNPVTYGKLAEFVDELHEAGMHYMLIFDPGLSQESNYEPYTLATEMDVLIKNSIGKPLVGRVWNKSGRTVFPDFSHPKATDFWSQMFAKFHQQVNFDGAWIDMNDISNFVDGSLDGCPASDPLENPPYKPGGVDLQHHSLCLSAKHHAGNEYDVHNLYSHYEAIATYKALEAARPGKRPVIISRSTSPGQGRYSGHWSGDVLSNWDYLRWSIPSLIEHSMYGFTLMGSDICGFKGNTTPELCARWSTLGAFYTFARNHNDDTSIDQDPAALGPDVLEANLNALTRRYYLLAYLYTQTYRAHLFGEPVVRAMVHEFFFQINDDLLHSTEDQFMLGPALLVSPIVEQNSNRKKTYLPAGRWFETNVSPKKACYSVPAIIDSTGQFVETQNVSLADIPLFLRAGLIMPVYPNVAQTTTKTADQPIGLDVMLAKEEQSATGEVYLDQGDNVDGKFNHAKMDVHKNVLTVELDADDYAHSIQVGKVRVMGLTLDQVSSVKVRGKLIPFKLKQHMLEFDLMGQEVTRTERLQAEWH